MRHDCDCNHNSNSTLDHVWTGDELIPWTLDYLPTRRGAESNSKKASGSCKKNWNINLHIVLSKALTVVRILVLAGIVISVVGIFIYAML